MTTYEFHNAGNTEAQQKEALTFLLRQAATGLATTGVLTGLAVTQTGTASGSVLIGAGAAVAQAAVLDGASVLVNDTQLTLDIFTANPMGGLARNDIVVFDAATISIRAITGTASATPADPTVPASATPLARLRHAASATTIPSSKIDDLRVKTAVVGASDENFSVRGVPMAGASTTKAGKRGHWGVVTTAATNASGYVNVTHGAGFTPTVVVASNESGYQMAADSPTSTTFRIRVLQADGSVYAGVTPTVHYFVGE